MKTNFARHYKLSLSNKAKLLVFSIFAFVLLTAAAFAISQNASAIEESINEAVPNFYMDLKVEGPGTIQKDSIDAFSGGKVFVSDYTTLNTESGTGTLHYHDSCSAFPNNKAVFDGWYWETGGRITKAEGSRSGVPIIAKFSEGWVLTFNTSEHGNLTIKNEHGRLVSGNTLTVPKGTTCSWDGFTLKFNRPDEDKDLVGSVEWTADQGYYLAEWSPSMPETITSDITFTPIFKKGYKIDVKWDANKGDVRHVGGTEIFPFYVEVGTDVEVFNDDTYKTLIFYLGGKETEDVAVWETYGGSTFVGWFNGTTMLTPGRYDVNCDMEIQAQIVDSALSVNFNVAEGQSSFGHVSADKFNDIPIGTPYTINGDTFTVDYQTVSPVKAEVDDANYLFDYWSIGRTILEDNGKIYYPLTVTAHFIHKDNWRITGEIVRHNFEGIDEPVQDANIYFYVEDEEHSRSHLITTAISQEKGFFEIYIPNTITNGSIAVAHDTQGTGYLDVVKPAGYINDCKVLIEKDPNYVYFYGHVCENSEEQNPIEGADIAVNFNDQPGKFSYAQTNSNGDYILKADKNKEAGMVIASAYGYVMDYQYLTEGQMLSIESYRYNASLKKGITNTFYQNLPLESYKNYKCDLYVNNILRLEDNNIAQDLEVAVPDGANAKIMINYEQVTITYEVAEKPWQIIEVKYVVQVNLQHWGIFDEWNFNGVPTKEYPWNPLHQANTLVPYSIDGVCIDGLVEGEGNLSGVYQPLEGADVFVTDADYNVLDHTITDSDLNVNYYMRALPQKTEAYLIVIKDGYKPLTRFVSEEETKGRECKIDVQLDKAEPGDEAYIYGQVYAAQEGASQVVANAEVFYMNEDSSVASSTLTSRDGYYLLKVPYNEKGTIACLANGYKPFFEKLEIQSLLTVKNILLDKSGENVSATFKYTDKQENYLVEVVSTDGTVLCHFVHEEQFSLQFEKDNKYAILQDTINFIYGDYVIRIKVNSTDKCVFSDWIIDPVPTTAGTLSVNSSFTPTFTDFCLVDSTWDKNFGNVTTTKSIPYKEIENSTYVVQDSVIKLQSNNLIAQENEKGYFLGWYVNDSLLADGSYTLTDDVVFEARFISRFNTVSFLVADGQKEIGKVEPSSIEATFGSTYKVEGNTITVAGKQAIATSLSEYYYAFDYWTLNGEKVTGSGYVYEALTFVAHFKELTPWHIKGTVYSKNKSTTIKDAYVLAYDESNMNLVDSVQSGEDGSYDLAIPLAVKDVYIFAAHIDHGYNEYNVQKPTTEVENLDIILENEMSYNLLYGNVSKSGTGASLEGVDVYYVFDNDTSPLHTTTDENGDYYFRINRSPIVRGTVYFIAPNYIINSKSYDASYIRDNVFIDCSVELSLAINQTIVWPTDASCEQISEDVMVDGKKIFSESLTETFSFAVNGDTTKLKVDSNTLSFKFMALENNDIEYKYSVENKEGFKFSHWLLNGAPVEDGAEIDITKANTLTPVSVAVCEISGTIFTDPAEESNDLIPVEGVQVVFYDKDNRIIASNISDNDGKWSFGDTVLKGSSGSIVYLMSGFKPQLEPIYEYETLNNKIEMFALLQKSEKADDCYVYGQVVEKTETNADPTPIPNAYIMFYNTEDGTYKECYADANGTYLLAAEQGEKGYLLCIADGYRPSFSEFTFSEYIQVKAFELEKNDTDVNANFPLSLNQKCFKIEVLDKDTYETYAEIDYYGSLNLNFEKNTKYYSLYDYVTILGNEYTYRFTAVPDVNYDFYKWTISSGSTTGILSADTSFTPSFVYQTSPVILNKGEAVKGFNYKYYINDTLIWDKDEDYVQDESYVNTVITVNENGIIESHFNVDLENNEGEIDLWSQVTPQVEDGYIYDSLYVNDELLEPGEELVVENGNYYFAEINYKLAPQPEPPTPDPDNPEIVNGAQTGDGLLPLIMILVVIIAVAGVLCFRKE